LLALFGFDFVARQRTAVAWKPERRRRTTRAHETPAGRYDARAEPRELGRTLHDMRLPLKRRSNEGEKFDATSAVVVPSVEEHNSKCRSKRKITHRAARCGQRHVKLC